MKFIFFDHESEEELLSVATSNIEFGQNIFNLFMVEMCNLHGPSFTKITSDKLGEGAIRIVYTNNVVCHLEPAHENS